MEKKDLLVYFNSRDMLLRIPVSQIVYFEADGNYTNIVTTNKLKACLCMNLGHTEQALAMQLGEHAHMFMRIGKSAIVNMRYICKVDIAKQQLLLSDFQHFTYSVPASKEALKSVKELIILNKI